MSEQFTSEAVAASEPQTHNEGSAGAPRLQPYRTFDEKEIYDIFIYHAPTVDQVGTYSQITDAFIQCAKKVAPLIPDGPGKTVAIRKLAEARMAANAAVALEGKF